MHNSLASARGIIAPPLLPAPGEIRCNIGWPMQRTSKQTISAKILGGLKQKIRWPSHMVIGLIFPRKVIPVVLIEELLRDSGYESAEALRERYAVPPLPLTCRTITGESTIFLNAASNDPEFVLRQALLLGLCGESFYDPSRPVIWTNKRLTRKVELFEVGEFYADN